MNNFTGILEGKYKVYVDPFPTESYVCGFKAWVRTEENIENMRKKLNSLIFKDLSKEEKDAYIEFRKDISEWDDGDRRPYKERGFFYCPYIPV